MKKKYACSIFMKILLLLLELLFLFSGVVEFFKNNYLISLVYILGFLLWIIFDYVLLSIIIFDNENIKIINKFKMKKLEYSNISKVQIIENVRAAFLFGSTFDFIFTMKDDNVFKFHVCQILRVNKLKRDIQKIFRLKCIKIEEKDVYNN